MDAWRATARVESDGRLAPSSRPRRLGLTELGALVIAYRK